MPEAGARLCGTLSTFENETYPLAGSAPQHSFTWQYPFKIANASVPRNQTQPLMHAFPQVSLNGGSGNASASIPIELVNLGDVNLDFKWNMGIGDNVTLTETSTRRLAAQEVNATVVLDMYMDTNVTRSSDPAACEYEILIMFANFGLQNPIGFRNGSADNRVATQTIAGTRYDLFAGTNADDQNVFTWVAAEPVTELRNVDIGPLFDGVFALGTDREAARTRQRYGVDVPPTNAHLGSVGFGTQAYNSIGMVTYSVDSGISEDTKSHSRFVSNVE